MREVKVRPLFAEIWCKSHYSFLEGASSPDELMTQACAYGIKALGITDSNGVYGLPKAFAAQKRLKEQGLQPPQLLCGAEVVFENAERVTLLAKTRLGYARLCRLLTDIHKDKPKGEGACTPSLFDSHLRLPGGQDLWVLPRDKCMDYRRMGRRGRAGRGHNDERDKQEDDTSFFNYYAFLKSVAGNNLFLPIGIFYDGWDDKRWKTLHEISNHFDIPLVATADVQFHSREKKSLHDILLSTAELTPLSQMGRKLQSNAERMLQTPEEMYRRYQGFESYLHHGIQIAEACVFSLTELKYRYPVEWIPEGHSAQSYLGDLVWKGAHTRYPTQHGGIPEKVRSQIEYELALVERMAFADYFLTIWDIVDFATKNKILCQGRGSAANSILCYVLGITAIDPVKMDLLFERFISEERGEPPDIDIDFQNDRREEVLQYVYQKYGRDRAAMVSTVITYQKRSALRDVNRAFGFPADQEHPPEGYAQQVQDCVAALHNTPRHRSIHSGGFTLSADPIIEIVPVEPARMEGRTVIQWDKYDLDILGLLKVDLLALGMLTAIQKTFQYLGGGNMYSIPHEDRETYAMIQKGHTVGVFQIESRAQIGMLGRLQPENFYDLVIEVAIVRPGPIVGQMVHPYLKRRRGLEPIDIPHPALEPILKRTLGIPLFQEQVMKMAMVLADFTPGEADQLRRAIGAWRASGEIEKWGRKLQTALLQKGLPKDFVDRVFLQIHGFAEYGFPESHAASFALITYVSCFLKCHYPTQFTCALLNAQPMGFYSPYTLLEEARRQGVKILPVHPNLSVWDCLPEAGEVMTAEQVPTLAQASRLRGECQSSARGAIRLGFCMVKGMGKADAERIITERKIKKFDSAQDFVLRTKLKRQIIQRMALGNAFAPFWKKRHDTFWEVLGVQSYQHDNSLGIRPKNEKTEQFVEPSEWRKTRYDFSAFGVTTRDHPVLVLRTMGGIPKNSLNSLEVKQKLHGAQVFTAGRVIVRQRPPTAKGTCFATLEDEHGLLDLVFHKTTIEKYRDLFFKNSYFLVTGILQQERMSRSVLVKKIAGINPDVFL